MSHSMPKIVSPALVRNLLKQSFKLRIPGDAREDLSPRTINLPPQVDIEIEYRDFQVLLPELLDLRRKRVLQITRFPEIDSISVEKENTTVVEKVTVINFGQNLKVESREAEESHGRVKISLDWDQVSGPGDLPPGPSDFQTVLYAADGLYLWDPQANAWVSATMFNKSWQKPGTATAVSVELGRPFEFKRSVRVMRVEISPTVKVDVLDDARTLLFSSASFSPITIAQGTKILPVRVSTSGAPITDPTFTLYYREILSL